MEKLKNEIDKKFLDIEGKIYSKYNILKGNNDIFMLEDKAEASKYLLEEIQKYKIENKEEYNDENKQEIDDYIINKCNKFLGKIME